MLRVGIVGVGTMGSLHAAAWAATPATIGGFFALDQPRAEALALEHNARAFWGYEELLENVDVVDICTPTYLHHHMAIHAAQAGKHVICEKPLALSIANAQAMIDACAAAGVKLLVGHVVRFFPEYALAKASVDRGDIGRVAVTRLKRVNFQPMRSTGNWFLDPEKSGGMIVDLMIHDFDYARWLNGEVETVFAHSVRTKDPNAAGDYCLAILTHKNGALTHVEGGWAYPPPTFLTAFEIAGEHGLIEHPVRNSIAVSTQLMQREGGPVAEVGVLSSPMDESPYTTEIKHYYDILTGALETPRVTAEDGLEALRLALAVEQSARTGRPVRVEEVA